MSFLKGSALREGQGRRSIRLAKQIQFSNYIAVGFWLVSILPVFLVLASFPRIGIPLAAVIVCYWLGPVLNAMGHHHLGRATPIIVAGIGLSLLPFAIGYGSGVQACFFPLSVLPFVLFDIAEARWLVLLEGFPFLCVLVLTGWSTPEHLGLPSLSSPSHISSVVVLASMAGQSLVLSVFYASHRRAENRLSELVTDLEREIERRGLLEGELVRTRDEALRAAAVKSAFLTTMSHEIRTPLHGVIGTASLLAETALDKKQREMVATVTSSGDYLLKLINNVLDYSKLHSGKLELESIAFEPTALLSQAAQTFTILARERGLSFSFQAGHEPGLWLKGDPARLRQVVTNLIGNAIKFTTSGSIRLLSSAVPDGTGRVRFGCSVEDTGVGVPEAARERIFDAFAQADLSVSRVFGGTGLGLAISKTLVQQMGGVLTYRPREGGGSMFSFSVSLAVAEARAPSQGAMASTTANVFAGKRILVAEDNIVNQQIVEYALRAFGSDCVITSNGQEALEAYEREHFDLVLMDVQMPVLDGLSATRAIRAHEPEGQRIPILGFTASVFPEERETALASGIDAIITKPIAAKDLREALRPYLEALDDAPTDALRSDALDSPARSGNAG